MQTLWDYVKLKALGFLPGPARPVPHAAPCPSTGFLRVSGSASPHPQTASPRDLSQCLFTRCPCSQTAGRQTRRCSHLRPPVEAAPWTLASAPAVVAPGVLFSALALASPCLTHLLRPAHPLLRPTSIRLRGHSSPPLPRPQATRPIYGQAGSWKNPCDPPGTGVCGYLGAASARPRSPPRAQGSPSRSRCTPSVRLAPRGAAAGCEAPQLQPDTGPLTPGRAPAACSHRPLSVAVPLRDRHSSWRQRLLWRLPPVEAISC